MDPLYQNCVICALAAIGLVTLLWLLASLLLLPRRKESSAVALLPVKGTAPELEFTLRRLLHCPEAGFSHIVILDLGLQQDARQRACLLLREDPRLLLCRKEELTSLIENHKEA